MKDGLFRCHKIKYRYTQFSACVSDCLCHVPAYSGFLSLQRSVTIHRLILPFYSIRCAWHHSVNSNPIQWEWSNFDPSQNPNPLTDYDKTLHNWLCPRDEHVTKKLCQSAVRERLAKCVKYKASFLFFSRARLLKSSVDGLWRTIAQNTRCDVRVTDRGLRMAGRVDFMVGHPRSLVASWRKLQKVGRHHNFYGEIMETDRLLAT